MNQKQTWRNVLFASFLGLLLAGCLGGFHFYQSQKEAQELEAQRKEYEDFIKNHPYSNRTYKTKQQYKESGLPRKDRPDWAMEQDFLRTFDPVTKDVPAERLHAASASLQKYFRDIEKGGGKGLKRTLAATNATWIERGPNNIGGRTRAIMFDPNDATKKKVWAGGVGGGLWYNNDITDANSTWTKVNDLWNNIAISCITYDPSNTNIFYVGTGEAFFGGGSLRGSGIWKTTDGGVTWNRLASTLTTDYRYIVKIIVNNSGHVFAATQVNVIGTGGVHKSTDGGTSWTTVLAPQRGIGGMAAGTLTVDAASDIEIAQNGDIYAACGTFLNTSTLKGLIYRTSDGGTTWTNITPAAGGYRIEMAIAPSTGATTGTTTIYAIGADDGNAGNIVWFRKSTDGGTTWSTITVPKYVEQGTCAVGTTDFTRGQSWYDLILAVHPTDPNTVFAGGIDVHRTTNGGTSWSPMTYWTGGCLPYVHADIHNIIFRPTDVNTLMIGCDGGVFYTGNANAGSPAFGARNKNYNVTQFYAGAMKNLSTDPFLIAGAQDNGSLVTTANGIKKVRAGDEATGGDGAFCFVDQTNANTVISSYVTNVYYKSTDGGQTFSALGTQDQATGSFINPCDFTTGFLYSYRAANGVARWAVPAGTRTNMTLSGSGTLTHIRVSPYTSTTVYVGNNAGKVYSATNMTTAPTTKTPTDRTASGALATGSISCIEFGASESEMVVTLSNYGIKSVFYTTDAGATWISKDEAGYGLPDIPVRWALMNPNNRKEVLLATEIGVYATDDITAANPNWTPVNATLANTRVDMLRYRSADGLVLAVTHGRGSFISDVFVTTPIADMFVENADQPHPFLATNANVMYQNATEPAVFYDNSLKATSYSWNFGTGASPSTAINEGPHSVTYNSGGKKTITLAINGGAQTKTRTDYIHILPYKSSSYALAVGGDFESNFDDFGVLNKGTGWERGNSAIAGKNGVVSGSNAWVTGLAAATYGAGSTSYLFTPNFNLSGAGTYDLSFSTKFSTEANYDGFIVEYSLNKGKTWTTLSPTVAANWYNATAAGDADPSVFASGTAFFSGSQAAYATMSRNISSLAGNANVAFRFTFKSDGSVNDVGVAIDNFLITYTSTGPTLTSATPLIGTGVDANITISGGGFTGTTSVSIGGQLARSFCVVNDNTIKAVTNDNIANGNISVTNGTTATLTGFVADPVVPRNGTITGTSFVTAGGFTVLRVNITPATLTQFRQALRYREVGATTWNNLTIDGAATSADIQGVTSNKAYEVYLQSYSSTGQWSNRSAITTSANSGTATFCSPTVASAAGIAGTTVTFNWTAQTNATRYIVRYWELAAPQGTCAAEQVAGSNKTVYVDNGAAANTVVQGLKPNTNYAYDVQVYCGSTVLTNRSNVITFTTGVGTACAVPTLVNFVQSTLSGYAALDVSWSGATGVTTGSPKYQLRYKTTAGTSWTYWNTDATSYTISGLEPSTQYDFQIAVFCEGGGAQWSSLYQPMTGAAPNSCPLVSLGASSPFSQVGGIVGANLVWTGIAPTAGRRFFLGYTKSGESFTVWRWIDTNGVTVRSDLDFPNLMPSSNYSYDLQVYCNTWNFAGYAVNSPGSFITGAATTADKQELTQVITDSELIIYPNPSESEVNILYSPKIGNLSALSPTIHLSVIDVLGREVYNHNFMGSVSARLDNKVLRNGVYIARINENGKITTKKFVVK